MRKAPAMWLLPLVALSMTTVVLATQQIIAIMDRNWIEIEAAQFLYGKNPEVSTVLLWNKEMKKFDRFLGKELDSTKLDLSTTHIQVVGHGGVNQKGIPTFGRLSPDDLAEALNSLYPADSRAGKRVISWMTLVGCNCATNSNTRPEDTFCGMLISKLREEYTIDTSISAYTTDVAVDSTGRELTIALNDDGTLTLQHRNPGAKIVYTHDKQGNLTTYSERVPSGDAVTCRASGIKPVDSIENGILVSVEDGIESIHVRLSLHALYHIIDGVTRNIFDNAAEDRDKKGNLRRAGVKSYIVRERTGKDTVRKVRQISSLQDLVNEINFFGRRVNKSEGVEYYRFSDYVMQMNTSNFYVKNMGVILNEIQDDVPDEDIAHHVAQSKYSDLEGDKIPEIGEKYWDMIGVDDDFFSDMRKFMNGKGEDISVNFTDEASRMAKATNGQRIIAMTLSESIRNFRCHVVNMIGLDLNAHGLLSHQQFFHAHPMARGGTWPQHADDPELLRPTGYEGSYGDHPWEELDNVKKRLIKSINNSTKAKEIIKNVKLVRKRSSSFLGSWLSNIGKEALSADKWSGGKQFVEQYQYQGAESPIYTIADVDSSSDFFDQAIINATQDVLVRNFRETTEKSAAIIDNPNSIKFTGPLLASGEQIETPEIEMAEYKTITTWPEFILSLINIYDSLEYEKISHPIKADLRDVCYNIHFIINYYTLSDMLTNTCPEFYNIMSLEYETNTQTDFYNNIMLDIFDLLMYNIFHSIRVADLRDVCYNFHFIFNYYKLSDMLTSTCPDIYNMSSKYKTSTWPDFYNNIILDIYDSLEYNKNFVADLIYNSSIFNNYEGLGMLTNTCPELDIYV